MEDIHTIRDKTVSGDLERIGTLGYQPALDEILDVGELDPGVSDGGTAEQVQQMCLRPDGLVDDEVVTLQKPLVAMLVRDDLHIGSHLGVPLDKTTNGRGQAWRKTAGRENGYLLDHEHSFQDWIRDPSLAVKALCVAGWFDSDPKGCR